MRLDGIMILPAFWHDDGTIYRLKQSGNLHELIGLDYKLGLLLLLLLLLPPPLIIEYNND
jgi:hypothetical protein